MKLIHTCSRIALIALFATIIPTHCIQKPSTRFTLAACLIYIAAGVRKTTNKLIMSTNPDKFIPVAQDKLAQNEKHLSADQTSIQHYIQQDNIDELRSIIAYLKYIKTHPRKPMPPIKEIRFRQF